MRVTNGVCTDGPSAFTNASLAPIHPDLACPEHSAVSQRKDCIMCTTYGRTDAKTGTRGRGRNNGKDDERPPMRKVLFMVCMACSAACTRYIHPQGTARISRSIHGKTEKSVLSVSRWKSSRPLLEARRGQDEARSGALTQDKGPLHTREPAVAPGANQIEQSQSPSPLAPGNK